MPLPPFSEALEAPRRRSWILELDPDGYRLGDETDEINEIEEAERAGGQAIAGGPAFRETGLMKTTFELPDDLLSEVQLEAARRDKKLEELVPELVRAGLRVVQAPDPLPDPLKLRQSEQWLEEWTELGKAATQDRPEGPTATEILAAHRRRLERP